MSNQLTIKIIYMDSPNLVAHLNPLGPKILTKFTPCVITADNYAPTVCSAAR